MILKKREFSERTEVISGKILGSPFTINTHSGNLIEKAGKSSISEVS